ncbi:MAG TPA: ABC transporter permease [Gemmatimonadaceae bacterium]|nr:ABC transporter permease [Gemmatimonadaceae bacterium]
MTVIWNDIRYAARRLARAPGFFMVATFTLALAIGAITAVFSVVNGVLLAPLPLGAPDRVMEVANIGRDGKGTATSALDYLDFRRQLSSFSSLAAYDNSAANLTGDGDPQEVSLARVGADFWRVMQVPPELGRGFAPNEDQPQAPQVAILSDRLWRTRYEADPHVLGRTMTLDGTPRTIIGVAPPSLTFPEKPDVWVPLVFSATDDLSPDARGSHYLRVVGRLAPGTTAQGANREMVTVTRRLEQQYPESNAGLSGSVKPLQDAMVGNVRSALLTLLAAVGFVLLIACANVANLQLVRASTRETEIAVRTALGAGRWQIVRQLLVESVLVSFAGGVLGVLLALWGVALLVRLGPTDLPRLNEVHVDGTVLGFTALVSLGTGLLFGLAPAIAAARGSLTAMLKETARGSSGSRASQRARSGLVMAELALAMLLLIGAGLLVRSFSRLVAVDPGFHPERVLTFGVSAPPSKYADRHSLRTLTSDILAHTRAIPGVTSAAIVAGLPLGGYTMRTSVHIVGTPKERPAERKRTFVTIVSPDYFKTMGIPLIAGRDFTAHDGSGAPIVSVIDETLAKRYFPGRSPIGQHLEVGWSQDTASAPGGDTTTVTMGGEIIGVVGDVRRFNLATAAEAETYIPIDQPTLNTFSVVVRTSGPPNAVAAQIRGALHAVDPDLPLDRLRQLREIVSASVARPRFYMSLIASFAIIALVLAAVGIYGVISYTVSQRSRELGIRIALGASGANVMAHVMRPGIALAASGVAIGVVASLALTRLIASLLFDVKPVDPVTFGAVAAVLLGVAVAACAVPARRASRVDPLVVMRSE